jgi:hypothetical protein
MIAAHFLGLTTRHFWQSRSERPWHREGVHFLNIALHAYDHWGHLAKRVRREVATGNPIVDARILDVVRAELEPYRHISLRGVYHREPSAMAIFLVRVDIDPEDSATWCTAHCTGERGLYYMNMVF